MEASRSDYDLKFFQTPKKLWIWTAVVLYRRLWLPKDVKNFYNSLHYNLTFAWNPHLIKEPRAVVLHTYVRWTGRQDVVEGEQDFSFVGSDVTSDLSEELSAMIFSVQGIREEGLLGCGR
jgi:hypothetical protein